MTLRVERIASQSGSVLRLIGQVDVEHLEEMRAQLGLAVGQIAFDLEEVTLVDAEAVRFFVESERNGIHVSNASAYIREWMKRIRKD